MRDTLDSPLLSFKQPRRFFYGSDPGSQSSGPSMSSADIAADMGGTSGGGATGGATSGSQSSGPSMSRADIAADMGAGDIAAAASADSTGVSRASLGGVSMGIPGAIAGAIGDLAAGDDPTTGFGNVGIGLGISAIGRAMGLGAIAGPLGRAVAQGRIGQAGVSSMASVGIGDPGQMSEFGGGIGSNGVYDAQIANIANDPNKTDEQKKSEISELVGQAGQETMETTNNPLTRVQNMANQIYGDPAPGPGTDFTTSTPGEVIEAIYKSELGRAPDDAGKNFYLNKYFNGEMTLQEIAANISASEEGLEVDETGEVVYKQNIGGDQSPTEFITQIYERELGRLPDAAGLQFYADAYRQGTLTAEDIARNISDSSEGMKFDPTGTVAYSKGPNAGRRPQDILNDPTAFLTGKMASLQENTPQMDPNAAGTNLDRNAYTIDPSRLNVTAQTAQIASDVPTLATKQAQGYTAATSLDQIASQAQATAQQGNVSNQSLVDAEQLDVDATEAGQNAVGRALNDAQTLNISRVIDTSTTSGRMLAQQLGDGNYTDSKATMKGQLDILSDEFTDAVTGDPKIPSWAAGAAREVSRIAAFKGMTGTAATAAMAQALMEASLPVAQQDAQFFQTATLENLSNRQQMAVTKAQVLSNMEFANLDARMTAAVENSKAFLQMDLANLDNRQQAEIVNTQARVQSILEDTRSENAARLFRAESQNDFTKFYDQMNTQIRQFNNEQRNAMERFNTGEINDTRQFNASLENQRELFYKDMQYNVDLANARWRQTVETTNTQMQFEAAKTDVQNIVQLSSEALNRVWDRADNVLDYAWRSSETALDRENKILLAEMTGDAQRDAADSSAKGSIWGAVAGAGIKIATEKIFDSWL